MPMMLESEALHSAAATLPPAIEVKTTDACTADGKVQRNIRPMASGGVSSVPDTRLRARPRTGKITKVAAKMIDAAASAIREHRRA